MQAETFARQPDQTYSETLIPSQTNTTHYQKSLLAYGLFVFFILPILNPSAWQAVLLMLAASVAFLFKPNPNPNSRTESQENAASQNWLLKKLPQITLGMLAMTACIYWIGVMGIALAGGLLAGIVSWQTNNFKLNGSHSPLDAFKKLIAGERKTGSITTALWHMLIGFFAMGGLLPDAWGAMLAVSLIVPAALAIRLLHDLSHSTYGHRLNESKTERMMKNASTWLAVKLETLHTAADKRPFHQKLLTIALTAGLFFSGWQALFIAPALMYIVGRNRPGHQDAMKERTFARFILEKTDLFLQLFNLNTENQSYSNASDLRPTPNNKKGFFTATAVLAGLTIASLASSGLTFAWFDLTPLYLAFTLAAACQAYDLHVRTPSPENDRPAAGGDGWNAFSHGQTSSVVSAHAHAFGGHGAGAHSPSGFVHSGDEEESEEAPLLRTMQASQAASARYKDPSLQFAKDLQAARAASRKAMTPDQRRAKQLEAAEKRAAATNGRR